ncbi:DNA-binding transcriptional regulator GbsR (MarR family) [Chitinophaga skermanii]|uniref:HTH-type transcriptional regulator n=1 Tax=Chitinophaga skermanii TaxID=331697 RepID=A0A327R3N2_9BACT|nr:MarR family transcriptional regulator [Chitinophaga skermanii]RAJ10815.1 DNA-binding transcriptional regulator GbsR (MarR family) [Chitinophaga skermanii]
MKLQEAKAQFIQAWGSLGAQWGINRTMAQIHALLLIAPAALSADEIMEELNISRGNTNMNVRELINWGIVEKVLVPGERKEFFIAEKDIWKVGTAITAERKKRELDPMLKVLQQLQKVEGDAKDKNVKAFVDAINGIYKFAKHTDVTLNALIKAEESWFYSTIFKLLK